MTSMIKCILSKISKTLKNEILMLLCVIDFACVGHKVKLIGKRTRNARLHLVELLICFRQISLKKTIFLYSTQNINLGTD